MSFPSKRIVALALSTATLGLAAGAFAQTRPAPPPGPQGPAGHPLAERMLERRADREAHQIKALHDVLNIRADQEPAFQAFTAALHPKLGEKIGGSGAAPTPPEPMPATTPERLARLEDRLKARDQQMQTRITAIKTFYAALNADQKHTFDSLPMLHSAFMERGPLEGPAGRAPGMWRGPDRRGPGGPGGPGQPGMGPPA
ncbi:MAG TPA: Spy/CpxP family protein refolding chaperone [Caulobacteraceae bacterium]|nr:Spy/CpxP family protein refolding chaperone [Caulobacteraceae bacterium]